MLEPIVQFGMALGGFRSNVGWIAAGLTLFNVAMYPQHFLPVILNIAGSRRDLGFTQLQRGCNLGMRPSRLKVMEDIPNAGSSSCDPVFYNHDDTYQPVGLKRLSPLF